MDREAILQQAAQLQQAGKLTEALDALGSILQVEPQHPAANYQVGLIACRLGNPAMGLPHFQMALKGNPEAGEYWLSYADALRASGQAAEAQAVIQAAMRHGLAIPEGYPLSEPVGAMGNPGAAGGPPAADVKKHVAGNRVRNKKVGMPKSGSRAERHLQVKNNRLHALFKAGHFVEVEKGARLLVRQYPEFGGGWKLLTVALDAQGRDALQICRQAVESLPGDAELQYNLAVKLHTANRLDEATTYYLGALSIDPGYFTAQGNLCALYYQQGRYREAEAGYRHVLALKPDYAEAHSNLAILLNDQGRMEEAMASFHSALKIRPDYIYAYSNLLFSLAHVEGVGAQSLFAEHCRFGERFEAPLRADWPQHTNMRDLERQLQVGFISADFRNHAVANFIEPLLAHLAHYSQLSLHAYSNNTIEDQVTQRLRGYFAHWNQVGFLSDDAMVKKIQADGIDILIDLSGHTTKHRLLTFARKPAPVQASWMGYPGTTGLQAMDYYLADRFFLPPGQFDSQFTEKIVRMPAGAPFLPSEDAPPVNPLPALSNGYVTFGSFNRPSKLSRSVIALWAQLLRALPDSRMVLGAMPEEGKYDTLIEWFAQEGIARERLDFHMRSGMAQYLSLHRQVDICLDTFPYNGGTTTLHALWMGVPTLTLAGSTAAGRPGASILGHAGLDEFVAHDAADFVQKGLSCVGNLAALSDIRAGLRERFAQSAMGQPAVVAAGVERALRIMWQRWCAGLPPESFEVTLQDVNHRMQETSK